MNNERVKAIVRLVVMFILFVNAVLTSMGKNPIPFDETVFSEAATMIAAGLGALWSWWKNANMTRASQEGQKVTRAIKEDGLLRTETEEEE